MFKPVGLFMCVRYEVVSLDRYLPIGFWPVDSGTFVGFLLRCVKDIRFYGCLYETTLLHYR